MRASRKPRAGWAALPLVIPAVLAIGFVLLVAMTEGWAVVLDRLIP